MSKSLAQQIAELEQALKKPMPDPARRRIETQLGELRGKRAKPNTSFGGSYHPRGYRARVTPPVSIPTDSTSNPTQRQITAQVERLKVERGNLAHYLRQHSISNSTYVEPSAIQGAQEARTAIKRIKTILRRWNIAVDDHPDDEAAE